MALGTDGKSLITPVKAGSVVDVQFTPLSAGALLRAHQPIHAVDVFMIGHLSD